MIATIKNWTSLVLLFAVVTMANAQQSCTASFASSQIAGTTTMVFTNTSLYLDSTAAYTAQWTFGDGTSNNDPYQATHNYAAAGTYTVCLTTAQANTSCMGTSTCQTVVVAAPNNCAYNVSLTDANGVISAVFNAPTIPPGAYWSVAGAHYPMNTTTFSYPYNAPGNYTICAEVPAGAPCAGSYCSTINVGCANAAFTTVQDSSQANTYHFTNTSMGNYTSATWIFIDAANNVHYANNLHNVTFTFSGQAPFLAILSLEDGTSCQDSASVVLQSNNNNVCTAGFTYTTQGVHASFNSSNSTSWITNATWNFDDGSAVSHDLNPNHTFAADGVYHVCLEANNAAACPTFPCGCHGVICHDVIINTHIVDSTCFLGNCVFPGDANHDGLANNYDVLSLGLNWGSTGAARADNSIGWYAHSADDWNINTPNSNTDAKHADCNGNGVINGDDEAAITANYNRTHNGVFATNRLLATTPIYLQFTGDTIQVGNGAIVYADIMIGNNAHIATDLYGLAFTVNYPEELIALGSEITMTYNTLSFLGTTTNVFPFKYDIRSAGQLDIALTRKAHTAVSGSGKIGRIGFTITDNISGRVVANRDFAPTISNIMTVNAQGELGALAPINTHTVLQNTRVATENNNNLAANVQLFPNPASNVLNIQLTDLTASKIEINNMLGQNVITDIIQERTNAKIDISILVAGVYNISITTDKGVVTKRFVVK